MRKLFLLLVVVCLAAALAVAQATAPANVCEIHINKVKPGATAQYEQGRAKHMAWHKSQNDSWSWAVWEITTGEGTGDYVVGTCGHAWKDFDGRDKFNDADGANANATIGPYLAASTMAYYVARPDLSPSAPPGPPPPYLSVITFQVKPEGLADFSDAVKKIMQAVKKMNVPEGPATWYSLANGGRGPEFVLVQESKSISELGGSGKTIDQIVQEAFGEQGAAILAQLRKAYYSNHSELLRFRPDLSYMPATAKP